MVDKQDMDVSAIATGALSAAQTRFDQAAAGIASMGTADNPVDSVSLSDQAVALLSARTQYTTDLKLIHVGDEMQQSALNLLA